MPDIEQESFTYSQLPTSTSIRLARRDGIDENGLLKISLIVVDLNAQRKLSPYIERDNPSPLDWPSFHCLSYTWGNPHAYGIGFEESFQACDADYSDSNLTSVRCNGKILKIRKNLHDFLVQAPTGWTRSIRNRPHPENGRILLHNRVDHLPGILHMYVGLGDDVNWQDHDGQTPLHHAARLGKLESVLILLKGGASIDVRDNDDQTAEDLAVKYEHSDVSNALREARDNGLDTLVQHIPPFMTESADDYIWIDALCIDQTNFEERASQVEIMSLVYSSAEYVVVWLGEEDDQTEHALSALAKLVPSAQQYADSNLVPYRDYSHSDYERYSVPFISGEEWQGLAALFLRRWFRRIWIIQEAVFANAIIMYCGTKKINWTDLQIVAAAFYKRTAAIGHDPSTSFIPINDFACGIAYHFEQVSYLREEGRAARENPDANVPASFDFEHLTNIGFPYIATDPRDKVYALLPLAVVRYGRELPLRANYRISAAECYANFALMQIMESGNLNVLTSMADASIKRLPNLPSWVPDYSLSAAMPLRLKFKPCAALEHLDGGMARFGPSKSWKHLCIKGVLIDVVANVAAYRTLRDGPRKFELDTSWFDLLDTITQSNHYDEDGQSPCEALWRTLCANAGLEGDCPAPPTYGAMFKGVLCAMMCAEPEINAREAEHDREKAIEFAGLLKTANLMRKETYSGPSEAGPDEAFMARLRSELPPVSRSVDSPHFDCVRNLLPRLELLRRSGNEAYIPSTDEIAQYFASGVQPLRQSTGAVYQVPGCEPFLNAHSKAYGGRRLFTTKAGYLGLGPASIEPGDGLWLAPGFGETMVLRQEHRGFLRRLGTSVIKRELETMMTRKGRCEFVGEAYVHGIMDGAAVKEIKEGQLRDLVLV